VGNVIASCYILYDHFINNDKHFTYFNTIDIEDLEASRCSYNTPNNY